jgi:hypothetical protein
VCIIAAIVLTAIGIVYLTNTAANLPAFFPGHAAHSAPKHYKHASAAIILALAALAGAWFKTAPDATSN